MRPIAESAAGQTILRITLTPTNHMGTQVSEALICVLRSGYNSMRNKCNERRAQPRAVPYVVRSGLSEHVEYIITGQYVGHLAARHHASRGWHNQEQLVAMDYFCLLS